MVNRRDVARLVAQYRAKPDLFHEDQIKRLKALADATGVEMDVSFSPKRAIEKLGFEAADTLLLGLLPDKWSPETLTTGEDIAGIAGDILGFAAPWGLGAGLAGKALGALGKAAEGSGALSQAAAKLVGSEVAKKAIKSGITWGTADMVNDLFEDGPNISGGIGSALVMGALPMLGETGKLVDKGKTFLSARRAEKLAEASRAASMKEGQFARKAAAAAREGLAEDGAGLRKAANTAREGMTGQKIEEAVGLREAGIEEQPLVGIVRQQLPEGPRVGLLPEGSPEVSTRSRVIRTPGEIPSSGRVHYMEEEYNGPQRRLPPAPRDRFLPEGSSYDANAGTHVLHKGDGFYMTETPDADIARLVARDEIDNAYIIAHMDLRRIGRSDLSSFIHRIIEENPKDLKAVREIIRKYPAADEGEIMAKLEMLKEGISIEDLFDAEQYFGGMR